jgi:hypothetical protein
MKWCFWNYLAEPRAWLSYVDISVTDNEVDRDVAGDTSAE